MNILLCNIVLPEVRQALTDLLPEHQIIACKPDEVAQHLAGVDIVTPFMTPIGAQLIEQGTFGLIQQFGVGLEIVDLAAATRQGVWVARIPSAGSGNAESVAEHAILLMLTLSRQLDQARQALTERRWGTPRGQALWGRRACIVGLGGLGTALALRLRSFGMQLTAVRAHPEKGAPAATGIERVYGPHELHTALHDSDYVILCARYDGHNHHMIDQAALVAMKPGAFLINVARGGLVDPDALLAALEQGHLAGAGLDVFWEEPVDPQHPLFRQHVIATPHLAGVTDAFFAGGAQIYVENVRRYAHGEAPLHTVNAPSRLRR